MNLILGNSPLRESQSYSPCRSSSNLRTSHRPQDDVWRCPRRPRRDHARLPGRHLTILTIAAAVRHYVPFSGQCPNGEKKIQRTTCHFTPLCYCICERQHCRTLCSRVHKNPFLYWQTPLVDLYLCHSETRFFVPSPGSARRRRFVRALR